MSATGGTIRGTTSARTVGRGRLPDFDNSASHIPRPKNDPPVNNAGSDVGSNTMSGASRQRQNQSKRDEVLYFNSFESLSIAPILAPCGPTLGVIFCHAL